MGLFDSIKKGVSKVFGGGGGGGGWLGGAISLGGTIFDYFSSEDEKDAIKKAADRQEAEALRVALANKAISLYDARVAKDIGLTRRFEADAKAGLMYNDLQRLLATQRTRYAKSGVALKSGSPVKVMEQTVREAGRDIMNVKYKGRSAKAAADSLSERYKLLAEKGLRDAAAQASLIQEAADDASDAVDWGFRKRAISDLYEWLK